MILGQEVHNSFSTEDAHDQQDFNTFVIFNRKRNAHACIMSLVFIVLYPLGAISIYLPVDRIPFFKNTYLTKKVMAMHAPIQILAFVMMVGGMALGISIAHDLDYLNNPVHAHVAIGLTVVSVIIIFQPIMGFLQHRHFNKTGGKSVFAYIHRWIGRGAIVLGMINSGLGFQLAETTGIMVPTFSYIRNYAFLGVLVSVWFSLVVLNELRGRQQVAPADERKTEINE